MALRRRSRKREDESFPGFTDVVRIGAGGFSTVFQAREVETNRTVALKILNVHDVSEHAIGSFQRETFALGTLSAHPNIVTLYRTLATEDDRPVLVLELCHGSIWERIRDQGAAPPWESVAVAVKIAGALETAHRAGMLHRDIKPENILITQYGEPALADFGVARLQSTSQATAGVFGFTTIHAAPELLEGRDLSAATDVYGLASTLYQLIAGKAAFRSFEDEGPASVILRILRDPVQPLVAEGVPVALSDLLVSSMSKNPYDRPASALELADELRTIEAAASWPDTAYAIEETVAVEHTAAPRPGRFQVRGVDAPWEAPDDNPAERPAPLILSQPAARPDAPAASSEPLEPSPHERELEPAASSEVEPAPASSKVEPAANSKVEPAAASEPVKAQVKRSSSQHQPDPASETFFARSGPGRVDVPRRERRVITPQGRPVPAAPAPIRPSPAATGAAIPTTQSATPAPPPAAAAAPPAPPPPQPVAPHFPTRPAAAPPAPPPPPPVTRNRPAPASDPLPPSPASPAAGPPPRPPAAPTESPAAPAGSPPAARPSSPAAPPPPRQPGALPPRRPGGPPPTARPASPAAPPPPRQPGGPPPRRPGGPPPGAPPTAPAAQPAAAAPTVGPPPQPPAAPASPRTPPSTSSPAAPKQVRAEQARDAEPPIEIVFPLAPDPREDRPEPMVSKPEPTPAALEAEPEPSPEPEPEPEPKPKEEPKQEPELHRQRPAPIESEPAAAVDTGPTRIEPARFKPDKPEPKRPEPRRADPEPAQAPAAEHAPAPRFEHLFDEEEQRAVPTIRPVDPPIAATTAQHPTSWARPRFLSQSFSMDLDDDSNERRTRPTPVVKRTDEAPPIPLRTASVPNRDVDRVRERGIAPATRRSADKDITAEHPVVKGDDAGDDDQPRKSRRRQKRR